jgi:hypothetical protein
MSETIVQALPQAAAPAPVAYAAPAPAPAPEATVTHALTPAPAPGVGGGTITVGSRISSGLRVVLPSGNYLVGGTATTHSRAGYAATPGIPAAEFESWLVEHADVDFVRKGLIIVLSREQG